MERLEFIDVVAKQEAEIWAESYGLNPWEKLAAHMLALFGEVQIRVTGLRVTPIGLELTLDNPAWVGTFTCVLGGDGSLTYSGRPTSLFNR